MQKLGLKRVKNELIRTFSRVFVLENAKVRVRIERENMKNTKKDEKNCKKTGESEYLSRSLSETRKSVSS